MAQADWERGSVRTAAMAERVAREMLLAGASGRKGWVAEQEAARRRRALKATVRDTILFVCLTAGLALFLWAAARGLDGEGAGWAVGDYGGRGPAAQVAGEGQTSTPPNIQTSKEVE